MKRFFIFTSKYEGLLNNFAEKASEEKIIYIKNRAGRDANFGELSQSLKQHLENKIIDEMKNFSERATLEISIAQREKFCAMLLTLLCDIAEAENPVYKYSAKLREMSRELRKTSLCEKELSRLKKFISASKEINLEGYVTFRMDEFNEKLDMMIYSLAKKLKFGKLE